MAANLVNVTNISGQVIPILINSISADTASAQSDIPAAQAEQMFIQPGVGFAIEQSRVDIGQLEQLARKKLITFTQT